MNRPCHETGGDEKTISSPAGWGAKRITRRIYRGRNCRIFHPLRFGFVGDDVHGVPRCAKIRNRSACSFYVGHGRATVTKRAGMKKPISSPAGWGADTAYGGETSPPTKPHRGQIKQCHTQRERRKTDFPLYLPREKLPYFSPTPFRVRRGRRPRRPTIQALPLIPRLFVRTILVSLLPHINAKKAEQARNLLSLL